MAARVTVGDYLLQRLSEAGVSHVFGVPGDFNLEFIYQLEKYKDIKWVGNCNELNASYAADAYARIKGLSALVVTNGVGSLSAINGIAGSFTEHVPVIVICGVLPIKARDKDEVLHHSLCDWGSGKGGNQTFGRLFAEVTAASVHLRPENAAAEIDRAIETCYREKKPVYIELPADVSYVTISGATRKLTLQDQPESDPALLKDVVEQITKKLEASSHPALVVDMDVGRFNLSAEVRALAEKSQIKIVLLNTGKGSFDEEFDLYQGVYPLDQQATETIKNADLVITVGHRSVDMNNSFGLGPLPSKRIDIQAFWTDIDSEQYLGVSARDVLKGVEKAASQKPKLTKAHPTGYPAPHDQDAPLTQALFWSHVQKIFRPNDIVVSETGTSSAALSASRLPKGAGYVSQILWGSIGYSVPALLGTLLAAPDRRNLLFVGDGSFQLTAQELSTIIAHDLKPIIVLLNNKGYTIERSILGKNSSFNDVANWQYSKLPEIFTRNPAHKSFTVIVKTTSELEHAFAEASKHNGLSFIEVELDPMDALPSLKKGGSAAAEIYGKWGPQHEKDVKL